MVVCLPPVAAAGTSFSIFLGLMETSPLSDTSRIWVVSPSTPTADLPGNNTTKSNDDLPLSSPKSRPRNLVPEIQWEDGEWGRYIDDVWVPREVGTCCGFYISQMYVPAMETALQFTQNTRQSSPNPYREGPWGINMQNIHFLQRAMSEETQLCEPSRIREGSTPDRVTNN